LAAPAGGEEIPKKGQLVRKRCKPGNKPGPGVPHRGCTPETTKHSKEGKAPHWAVRRATRRGTRWKKGEANKVGKDCTRQEVLSRRPYSPWAGRKRGGKRNFKEAKNPHTTVAQIQIIKTQKPERKTKKKQRPQGRLVLGFLRQVWNQKLKQGEQLVRVPGGPKRKKKKPGEVGEIPKSTNFVTKQKRPARSLTTLRGRESPDQNSRRAWFVKKGKRKSPTKNIKKNKKKRNQNFFFVSGTSTRKREERETYRQRLKNGTPRKKGITGGGGQWGAGRMGELTITYG